MAKDNALLKGFDVVPKRKRGRPRIHPLVKGPKRPVGRPRKIKAQPKSKPYWISPCEACKGRDDCTHRCRDYHSWNKWVSGLLRNR